VAERQQQPRSRDIGAPCRSIETAEARQPARHQRLGDLRAGSGVGYRRRQVAQPFPAIGPVPPRRRRSGRGIVEIARHLRMTSVDHSSRNQPFTGTGISRHRVLRHSEQLERIAPAQPHPVQRRLVQRRRDPRCQPLAQRQPAVAGDPQQPAFAIKILIRVLDVRHVGRERRTGQTCHVQPRRAAMLAA